MLLFFSVAPFAPLLKYTCYMCNRHGAHKSHRISSFLCSHDNALLYLYWYLHFMLIWQWCELYYVWWEAIKLFWIFESLNISASVFIENPVVSISIWGSFYWHGWTLIPVWISNHLPSKVWDNITHPLPNFNSCTMDVWEWISNFITLCKGCNDSSMMWWNWITFVKGACVI